MEIKTETDVNRNSFILIGEKLRSAREKKGLSIDQVQKQTRIHSSILTALEEGRCAEMLNEIYVRSFLRKYSGHLGIDFGEMAKAQASPAPAAGAPAAAAPAPAQEIAIGKDRSDLILKFIFGVSIALLATALFFLATFVVKKAVAVKRRPGPSARAVPAAKTLSAVQLKAQARAQGSKKTATDTRKTPQVSIPKNMPINMVLKVKEQVRIGVRKDGVLLFKRVMPKGAVETISANDRIEIYAAKGEAIELVLNNKSLGSPGRGVIQNLEVTRSGIKIE